MPIIPIDFSAVEEYDNLPLGKYYGQIDKVELRPTDDPSKFDQFQVAYMVTDGDLLGRKQSEFLSLSPKAAFRLKKFFDAFGLSDELESLDVDDETNLLVQPDLVGVDVIFEVYEDPKLYKGEKQIRTRLVEVIEEAPAPAPVTAAAPARRAVAAPAPVLEEIEEAEAEEEEEEEPVPAPARRPLARTATAAPAAATAPARRTLK